ncbi:unnamed protein product, partial [Polarella glacialis]
VRVVEECTAPELSSLPLVSGSPVTTKPLAALPPSLPTVVEVSKNHLLFTWASGELRDCAFKAWRVQWQVFGLFEEVGNETVRLEPTWTDAAECSSASAHGSGSCNLTSMVGLLSVNVSHELRVQETCGSSLADSAFTTTPRFWWTSSPEVWYVRLGPSQEAAAVTDVLSPPDSCVPVPQAIGQGQAPLEFSVCHSGPFNRTVSVTRTDVPSGWTYDLWLKCVTEASLAPLTAARAPTLFQLSQPATLSLTAGFQAGPGIGSCSCASLRLQLRANGSSAWTDFGGGCSNISSRQCMAEGLLPDTLYEGRLQVACQEAETNSDFISSATPVATLPGCKWSTDSGRQQEYQCGDGTYCDWADEA